MEAATATDAPIYVSAYSLVELIYAVERASNPFTEDDRQAILSELTLDASPFEVVPVNPEVANRVARVPRAVNPDPGDRIIIATAELLGVPIVSSDGRMPAMTSNPDHLVNTNGAHHKVNLAS